MLKIEINEKKYKIPESFEELTLNQYCKAFYKLRTTNEEMDEIESFRLAKENESIVLSRLMGEPDDFCMSLPLNIYAKLNEAIQFIYNIDYFIKNAKAGIVIDNKRYSIPPFNEMSLRQYIDADVVLQNESDNQYIELLSILLLTTDEKGKWKPYNGNYQEMMTKVGNLTCNKALPLVYHFFKKSRALQTISNPYIKMEANQQHQSIQGS